MSDDFTGFLIRSHEEGIDQATAHCTCTERLNTALGMPNFPCPEHGYMGNPNQTVLGVASAEAVESIGARAGRRACEATGRGTPVWQAWAMTPALIAMRGLPASGKTTWARAWVAEYPDHRARVSVRLKAPPHITRRPASDAVRAYFTTPNLHLRENTISATQDAAVRGLLEAGCSVVVDDTNLRIRYLRKWAEIARDTGATFGIESFMHVPLATCIERDEARGSKVGQSVIEDMWAKTRSMGNVEEEVFAEAETPRRTHPYERFGRHGKEWAYIVDIDGTVALMNGRSPYDYSRVSEDLPNHPVLDTVKTLCGCGGTYDAAILFVSGRDAVCRDATMAWLNEHVLHESHFAGDDPHATLLMRAEGDSRDDATIKEEIFWRDIEPRYNVLGVFDDRNRVVRMWRRLGLTCYQVADGAF